MVPPPPRFAGIIAAACDGFNRWMVNNLATLSVAAPDYMAVAMSELSPFEPYEIVAGPGDIILVCDHARNDVPPELGDLGVSPDDMRRHTRFPTGARFALSRVTAK